MESLGRAIGAVASATASASTGAVKGNGGKFRYMDVVATPAETSPFGASNVDYNSLTRSVTHHGKPQKVVKSIPRVTGAELVKQTQQWVRDWCWRSTDNPNLTQDADEICSALVELQRLIGSSDNRVRMLAVEDKEALLHPAKLVGLSVREIIMDFSAQFNPDAEGEVMQRVRPDIKERFNWNLYGLRTNAEDLIDLRVF